MRYFVSLDAGGPGSPPAPAPATVAVRQRASGELDVDIGGRSVPVDVAWLDGVASVRVGGRSIDLVLEGAPPEMQIIANGHRGSVRIESERQRAAAAALAGRGGARAGEKVIKAPMPGRIVKVLVSVGDAVEPGATLCVIEAMKMENEVKAKAACKVLEVRAVEGATVEAGSRLFALA